MKQLVGNEAAEHYVTVFDHRFLLHGLALYESLLHHQSKAHLWVLCLDRELEEHLARLQLHRLSYLSLRSLETAELLVAKANRSRTEYIYTLTPFTFDFVFNREPSIRRLTYVDADLYFYKSPTELLDRFERDGRQVLITEHGFSPEYRSRQAASGRFCVQFLSVCRDDGGLQIIRRWQLQCLQSCSVAFSGRKLVFGDQRYLEDWPERYPDLVYVYPEHSDILAPWNVSYYQAQMGGNYRPVFYHFHSFRIFHRKWAQMCAGYNLAGAMHLYNAYLDSLRRQRDRLLSVGISPPTVPFIGDRFWLARLGWRFVTGRLSLRRFS